LRQLTENVEPVAEVLVAGEPRALPTAIEHALFRAAQEGLTNVRKHADATKVSVALDFCDAQRVRLEVTDNGRGRDHRATSDGVGLRGLSERVGLLGGRMRAEPRAVGGFVLSVELPA
jgi:signal transduction histidine kinase